MKTQIILMNQPNKTANPAQPLATFQIGNRLAFELGRGATTGTVVAVTGENVLVRHEDGLDIFTLKDLAKRKAVIVPQSPTLWQRLFSGSNA
jgi:sRNA-binding protein